jgi:hypothetical protein
MTVWPSRRPKSRIRWRRAFGTGTSLRPSSMAFLLRALSLLKVLLFFQKHTYIYQPVYRVESCMWF